MTTSHEQPLSRRAARERERARLRGELPAEQPIQATPEPLEYATRGAESLPVHDAPRADEQPPTQALSTQDLPEYRARDYSPEGRRATPLTPSSFAPRPSGNGLIPPVVSPSGATVAADAPNDAAPAAARTDAPSDAVAPADVAPAAAAASAPTEDAPAAERTMTRRELRMLRARREAEGGGVEPSTHTDAIDFLLKSGPIELPYLLPPRPESDAPDEPGDGATVVEPAAAEPIAEDAIGEEPADGGAEADDERGDDADGQHEEQPPALVEPAPLAPAFIEPPAAASATAPAQASSDAAWAALLGRAQAQAEAGAPLDTPLDPIVPPAPVASAESPDESREAQRQGVDGDGDSTEAGSPDGGARSPDHWSHQAADDSRAAFEGGSTGSFAPSALVMPTSPHTGDFSYSLSTGEILVTGSIDLPRSLGATGAHSDRIDDPSIDHVLDPRDQELTSTDSAPVRAVRAVSSHTSTRGMIATPPKKARSTKYLTALVIATSVMAVVAVTLLIVAAVTGNL